MRIVIPSSLSNGLLEAVATLGMQGVAHLAARGTFAPQDAPGRAPAAHHLALVGRLLDARQSLAQPGPAVPGRLELRGCGVQLVRQVLWGGAIFTILQRSSQSRYYPFHYPDTPLRYKPFTYSFYWGFCAIEDTTTTTTASDTSLLNMLDFDGRVRT
jgi:hypothetical protein